MSEEIWAALGATTLDEVRRRAAIIDAVTEIEPIEVDGAVRFAWNDGGGQSAVWYFTPDGRALLLTFDHESSLNLFAEGTYAEQEAFYRGVPEDLVKLVRDRPENYESLNLVDPETGATILYAGGVFWFDGERWARAEGFLARCREDGLDPLSESGFSYCLGDYRFGEEFTPEAIVEARAEDGYYEDDADRRKNLAEIKEIFARLG
ncbi:hypothetical protein GCM10027598_65630 [Amycolatopsis oliviviridis]|uniref:Uncharacterized protein n=1 Tax=Amycolatopsis oliviviridis TaxID=1471590 RepID=A0ABQ3M9E0_9PSEU|nr:hypothetical protein [Amycolatopsis oliviviridis]GHH36412.1 hypothetical protein GCM10017790_79230 [Amycolatopsis oliviviridis]